MKPDYKNDFLFESNPDQTNVIKVYEDMLQQTLKAVFAQREEILTAFIAKYGCQPDEIEQVESPDREGRKIWYVRKKRG